MLFACATTPPPGSAPSTPAEAAERQQSRGDFSAAATLWEDASAASSGTAQLRYRLYAADAWWRAGDRQRASAQLELMGSAALPPADAARLALLQAERAVAAGDALQAEFYLPAARDGLEPRYRGRLRTLENDLASLRSDPGAQQLADARIALRQMPEPNALQGMSVLQALERVPASRLRELVSEYSRIGQWSLLSLDLRGVLMSGTDLLEAAGQWSLAHPRSEITEPLYLELAWQYGQRFLPPRRIAVLLPEAGNLSAAAAAIRDGLVAGVVSRPGGADVEFFAIGTGPGAALDAYEEAGRQGFDFIVGPLDRESVQQVVDLAVPQPTLLLNRFDGSTGGVTPRYSLALDQAEEAAALAQLMVDEGHRRVMMLVADGPWGARAEAAFLAALEAAGGELVAREIFAAEQADHSARLTELLKIADSRARKDALQSALGISLDFEATRRDDFEAIFMAADPVLGRQLKPQLRFYDAGDKPVYAMSRVYSGRPSQAADTDLNGVVFASTAWAFEPDGPLMQLDSVRGGAFGPLFTLGSDAWSVLPFLPLLAADPETVFPGQTGQLRLDAAGNLVRTPYWARFSRGLPRPYEPVLSDPAAP